MRRTRLFAACWALAVAPVAWSGEIPPRQFLAGVDQHLVTAVDPGGTATWAAWTLRGGAETDVAIALRDASGNWSHPVIFGGADGEDQRQPALAVDDHGTLYLAFTERVSGRVMLAALAPGDTAWAGPTAVGRARGAALGLRVFGPRLLVGFVSPRGAVSLLDFPLFAPEVQANSTNDGPDPVSTQWPEIDTPGSEARRRAEAIDEELRGRSELRQMEGQPQRTVLEPID